MSQGKDTPSFAELTNFLMRHCSMLETLNPVKHSSIKSGQSVEASKASKESVACISSKDNRKSNDARKCPLCQGNHSIYHCSKFKGLTIQAKWTETKRMKLCFNCLRDDHTSDKCRASNCKKCDKKHNILLHIDEFHPQNVSSNGQSNSDQSQTTIEVNSNSISLSSVQAYKSHIMSTALITIYDKFGKTYLCRAVLDSGSQSNMITKKLQER